MNKFLILKNMVLLVLVLFSVACSDANKSSISGSNTNKHSEKVIPEKVIPAKPECSKNSECVSVAKGCCSCNSGGKNKAITTKQQAQWLAKLQQQCRSTICPSVISNDASCSAMAVCLNGKCQLQSGNYK